MGFNDYLDPLVNVEGAISISTILLVDVEVGSFSPYIYVPTPWAKHTKTTVRGAPSLGIPDVVNYNFLLLSCHCQPTPTTPSVNFFCEPLARFSGYLGHLW